MKRILLFSVCFLSFGLLYGQDNDQENKENLNVKKDSVSVVKDTVKNDTSAKGNMMMHPFFKHERMFRHMPDQNMMGMMFQLHQNKMIYKEMPMKKYEFMVKIIPQLKDELDLSDDQLSKLLEIRAGFERQMIDSKLNLDKNKMKLQSMLKDEADAEDIRDVLEKNSDLEINMSILAYKTAEKMKELLSKDQIEKLRDAVEKRIGK